MNPEITDEILEQLASAFQGLETQSAALLEFVKDKGIAKDDDLAPYLERAGAASAVRWRAVRVRMARLLASAEKSEQHAGSAKREQKKDRDKAAESQKSQPPEKPAQADQHSQDEHSQDKRSTKQAESLASGPTETQAENDRANHAAEHDHDKDSADDRGDKPTREQNAA